MHLIQPKLPCHRYRFAPHANGLGAPSRKHQKARHGAEHICRDPARIPRIDEIAGTVEVLECRVGGATKPFNLAEYGLRLGRGVAVAACKQRCAGCHQCCLVSISREVARSPHSKEQARSIDGSSGCQCDRRFKESRSCHVRVE